MFLEKNKSWRLVKNIDRGEYCYLIGTNNWAIELKEDEFKSLYEISSKLFKQFQDLNNELMEEELINLEFESLHWYAELEGKKDEWSLRFVFEGDENIRSFEMYWPIQIAETLLFEIRKMWESMY